MDTLWTYLLQSAVSLILLYAVYALFLRRDTFFQANRFYLLGSVIFSLALPLAFIFFPIRLQSVTYTVMLDPVLITPDEIQSTIARHLSLFELLLTVYLTGAVLFTIRFLYQIIQIRNVIRKSLIRKEARDRIVLLSAPHAPFSFFSLIFISRDMLDSPGIRQVIEHEKVHIGQNHTVDIMLMEFLTIVQWFNPVIWYYRRSVKELHEYLADEGVIGTGADLPGYQTQLLNQAIGIQINDLTHNFNHSLLKKRIMMMTKEKSGTASRWKLLLPVPVFLALTMAFSGNMAMAQEEQKTSVKTEKKELSPAQTLTEGTDMDVRKDTQKDTRKDAELEAIVQPAFNYQGQDLITYLVTNIRYPDQARKEGITGKAFVQFVVDRTGKVINPEIVKSSNPLFDQEALRVVREMPDWSPGKDAAGKAINVAVTLPIQFALEENKKK